MAGLAPIHESHPLGPLFVVANRFDASAGREWSKFIEWSGLHQLSEVVSLDGMLCERTPEAMSDDDWPYIVNEHFMLNYFTDLNYLLKRAGPSNKKNLLCVYRNPLSPPSPPTERFGFALLGYDLVDVTTAISATLNCGGFPDVFAPSELNQFGLVDTLDRAREIQQDLRAKHGQESHADTHVWAIARAAL